jgi:hypothetical protein
VEGRAFYETIVPVTFYEIISYNQGVKPEGRSAGEESLVKPS